MRWSELAAALGEAPAAPEVGGLEVTSLAYDSRRVGPGSVFVAIPGRHHDGHDFVVAALARGALLAVVERHLEGIPSRRQVVVESSMRALARLAAAFYGHPTEEVPVVGVTGTDGKTTTCALLQAALGPGLGPVGSLTTVDFRIGDDVEPNLSRQTTLEALEVQGWVRRMVDRGCRVVVLEATSHGLALGRVDEVAFDGAVYTNITHEHLDFHGSWEAYFQAKALLLERARERDGFAVLNLDDQRAFPRLSPLAPRSQIAYSARGSREAELRALRVEPFSGGIRFTAQTPAGEVLVRLSTAGRWNVANALAALGAGLLMGRPAAELAEGMGQLRAVPGRMEAVDLGQPFSVIVDYAHTPEALTLALYELRAATPGRLWVVFGSAGERDLAKRSEMGRIAARLADQLVITSEDPRSEDPMVIIEEICRGAREAGAEEGSNLHRDADRAQAIRLAIGGALPGDTVLLAGKGHEHSILEAAGESPWDEREAAERALREVRGR